MSFYDAFDDKPVRPAGQIITLPAPAGGTPYGQTALTDEANKVAAAPEGTRNHQLNLSAFKLCQLITGGQLEPADVHDTLTVAARQAGLDDREIEATLLSAWRAGTQNPRQPEPQGLLVNGHAAPAGTITTLPSSEAVGQQIEQAADQERARTTWWPKPLVDRAQEAAETPAPTHLRRDDGKALFYSGKINGLIGESESGKSWVALLAVQQALEDGQSVLMLDFEDSPASIHTRMTTLGMADHLLAGFDYADPTESLGAVQSEDLTEALRAHAYQLIVVDGVNAAMTLLDLDLNSNTDATRFATKILRPLSATGACVITVDHVPKNSDQRGKGGIGAQAKRAMMDGCALIVEIEKPFGKGQSGTLKLVVDKDRNGHVRGLSAGGSNPGHVQVVSGDGGVTMRIEAAGAEQAGTPAWKPTAAMEAVSRFLESVDMPQTFNNIATYVTGRRNTLKDAVGALLQDGHIKIEAGQNRAMMHRLVKPYRELGTAVVPVVPGGSPVVPGTAEPGGSGNHAAPHGGPRPGTTARDTPETTQNRSSDSRNFNPWAGTRKAAAWRQILHDTATTWSEWTAVVDAVAKQTDVTAKTASNLLHDGVQAGVLERRGEHPNRQIRLADPQHPLTRDPDALNLADSQSSCNQCGQPADDAELDKYDGYCRTCSRGIR